ncbi:MAG: hypothetical protein ACREI9_04715 [Nitrospiraceae bacterium]
MYTSRRGFTAGGLGCYGLGLNFEPKAFPGSGLGAFMWSDIRGRGLRGLGAEEDPTEGGECPQPVHYTERDALRNEIKGWTNPSEGIHFHENHPDVRAIFDDIVRRLSGLEARPKLLRCSAEARSRANNWIGQLKDLQRRINKPGIGVPFSRSQWVRVEQPFQFTVYRGPTYTVRAGTPHPEAFSGQPATGSPTGQTPSSAPAGSVVVDGVTYPSSAAAAAATAPGSSGTPPEITAVTPASTGGLPGLPSFSLEGDVAGIPTKYLVYGVLALVGWRMLKGR